jgi:hypothetical protein
MALGLTMRRTPCRETRPYNVPILVKDALAGKHG